MCILGTQKFVETLDSLNGAPEVTTALTKANNECNGLYEPWFARALGKSTEVADVCFECIFVESRPCTGDEAMHP